MDALSPSDLKSVLHSKRANIYYLEHCRVLVNGGRVEYVTDEGKRSAYWNIPIANTTTVLLGTGTSVTQAAMRELAKAGVLVGFCGGGGTPLFWACPRFCVNGPPAGNCHNTRRHNEQSQARGTRRAAVQPVDELQEAG
ncbi:MAG: type I-F CRISPR-associated endonuclease Cas1f, partial [Xanthomonadaceae bacterium]|nr:type I-F CRISPR-associated endonuclease Cas1f [Xanthomonadaceae bacterium]